MFVSALSCHRLFVLTSPVDTHVLAAEARQALGQAVCRRRRPRHTYHVYFPCSRVIIREMLPLLGTFIQPVLCYHRRHSVQIASRWASMTCKVVRGKGRTGRGHQEYSWIVCHLTKVRKRKACCTPSCRCFFPPRTGDRDGSPWPLHRRRPTPERASFTFVSTIIWTICITLSTGAISGAENRTKATRYKLKSTYF